MYQVNCDTISPRKRTLAASIALCATVGVLVWSALPDRARAGESADGAFGRSVRITVRQGDLDNRVAVKRLIYRIEEAAQEVCGASPFSFPDLRRAVRRSECWRQSVSSAVAEIHDSRLNARLDQRLDGDRTSLATRQD
ncbi:MAG TPA: UrcA family protein [Caulobacteraceae bacterium]|nr:UrcA family protein [Caulobacteraceae bacterium]